MDECKSALSIVLPFNENEIEFLENVQKYSKIQPEIISSDALFCERIKSHPLLHWRGKRFSFRKANI